MKGLKNPDPGFWTKTSMIQIGYGIWANLTYVSIGLALGFPAVTVPQLNDADTTVTITVEEETLIAMLLPLSAPVGCIVCGFIMDRFGRRIANFLCVIPMILGWFYIAIATNAQNIIIGRVITGIGTGMAMGAPRVYVTEICLPNMRGIIGAFPGIAMSTGVIIQAALGSYLKWWTLSYIYAGYAIALFFINYWLPETPYFTLLEGNPDNVRHSLRKFRAKDYDIEGELEQLIDFKNVNNIRSLPFRNHMGELFRCSACKPFGIVTIYMLILEFSGVSVMILWTFDILTVSYSSIDVRSGNYIIGTTKIVSGIIVAGLLLKVGRKPMALISSIGVGITCLVISSYLHIVESPYPLICFIVYVITATFGYYTLPLLIMVELYPFQVRGLLGGVSVSILNLLVFFTNIIYSIMRESIGFANAVLSFGIFSLLGSIYIFLYFPETKGLTLQEIEEFYNRRRATLVSQRVLSARIKEDSLKTTKHIERRNKRVAKEKTEEIDNREPGPSNLENK